MSEGKLLQNLNLTKDGYRKRGQLENIVMKNFIVDKFIFVWTYVQLDNCVWTVEEIMHAYVHIFIALYANIVITKCKINALLLSRK